MKIGLRSCIALTVIFSLAGCAPTVRISRMKPAEINLSAYKKIAVAEMRGPGNDEVGAILTQALFDSRRFDVVDREHLGTIMREQNMSLTDSFDPASSVRIGKMIGSATIVFGKIQRRSYNQKNSVSKDTCRDKNGRAYVCHTHTVTGYWNFTASFKVVDVSTGKILATCATPYSTSRSNWERDGRPEADWDVDGVFTGLARDAVSDFMRKIAPYTVPVEVSIYKDGSLPELAVGIAYARQGDWPSAIAQFKSACGRADSDPDISPKVRARAHYDLGIAYGYSAISYDRAIAELQKAVEIRPEEIFFREQDTMREFRADDEQLKKQGIDMNSSRSAALVPMG